MATPTIQLHATEPLECWNGFYGEQAGIKDKGGIHWADGAWSFDAVPHDLGDDVRSLTGEPYGASIAFDKQFLPRRQETGEKQRRKAGG
ncbi:MAG: hypothetical protein ACYSX0_08790 [Planctomycetota bacterium]|jgi:benzoyl-CoA reductase subunit B